MNNYWQYILVLCLSDWISFIHGASIKPTAIPISNIKAQLDMARRASIAVNTTLHTFCHNTPLASAVSCPHFIHMLLNQTELTFPQLYIQDNITIAQTDLVKIALSNMSATLSQYVTVLKNQTEKEYNQLCAPAKRIETECHYPAACSKLTPTSDAIFYCYLKQTLSYLVDTILFLDSPIFSNIKQNVEVDDSLLLPDDVPIIQQRWFTIITLHTLHENINHIQNTLESFM
ncbi:uncharacterized protein LOC118763923 isoform X2 [Octopus sinensis]|uniref:Uncharacterized protein LOC118763923 isoform X2 n=1 Tax=Octopus sinensis TaxID=2607531 RepID=A0A7E6EWP1_9MOLL|nr:uncharacterized protein LOC118763923 isoform X2 [Octopus sinensis]